MWEEIGVVEPSYDWQQIGAPAVDKGLYRLRQQWVGEWPGKGVLQLSFLYSGAGRNGFFKLPSDRQPIVLASQVPPELIAAGLTERQLSMRLNLYARVNAGANWTVSVDRWVNLPMV